MQNLRGEKADTSPAPSGSVFVPPRTLSDAVGSEKSPPPGG